MKNKIKFLVDAATLIFFIATAVTGVVIKFLPGGARQAGQQVFWGITRRSWAEAHEITGILMIIFALIHVLMHWKLFVAMTKNLFKKSESCEVNTEVGKK